MTDGWYLMATEIWFCRTNEMPDCGSDGYGVRGVSVSGTGDCV